MAESYTTQQLLDAGFNPDLIPIIRRETGGKNVGWAGLPGSPEYSPGGTDLSGIPLTDTGRPAWRGKMGPAGNSTAMGVPQITASTWDPIARQLGVKDFSLESQAKVANELYRQRGLQPWEASAPLKPGEHRWVGGDDSGGGGQPLYLGRLEKNFHDTGNDLLDALLAQNYPKEDKPTGNGLLDQIMQQAVYGIGPPNQAQPAPNAAALGRIPQTLPPQTVPELSGQQVDIKPMQPLQQASMPMPGSQSQEYGREGLTPPNVRGPEPTPPPIPIPGSQDRNRFFNPNEVAPYNPPGVPDDRQLQASMAVPPYLPQGQEDPDIIAPAPRERDYPQDDEYGHIPKEGPALTPVRPFQQPPATGNGLLDRILKQLSPIASAQAAEPPTAQQSVPATPAAPTPVQPPPAQPQSQPAQQFIEPPAKGQQVPPAVQPRAVLPAPQAPTVPPGPMMGTEPGGLPSGASPSDIIQSLIDWRKRGGLAGSLGMEPIEKALANPTPIQNPANPADLAKAALDPRGLETATLMAGINPESLGGRIEPPALRTGKPEYTPNPDENPYQRPTGSGADFMQQFAASLRERRAAIVAAIEAPTAKIEDSARLHEELAKVDHALQEVGTAADQLEDDQLEEIAKQYGYVPRQEAPSEPLAPKQPEISPPVTPPGAPPPTGGGEMPPAAPVPPPPGIKEQTQALSDDLFKAAQSAEADRLEVQHIVNSLPDDLKGAADEQAYHERESRMTGKPIKPSATTQRIERLLKPMDDKIHADATWIREHAPDIYGQLQEKPLRTAAEGHVHRKVVGQKLPGEALDPQQGELITGLGGSGLSRRASGMMHRTPDFVLEDNSGNRIPGKGPKVGEKGGPARYGETFINPGNGVKYTVKEPTTTELEAKYPNRKYVKSLLANTFDNYLRLSRVRASIELLEKWKPELYDAGRWFPEASQDNRPANFVHVDVPQLRGWAEPHIAAELNDIYRTDRQDVASMLAKANKLLIGSMFALPVRHQLNVGAHYMVGRGADWLYRNPMLARAYQEVAHQGPEYLRYLRAGAGLRYASTLNENFYNTILGKLFHEQMTNPEWEGVFKELGHKAADVVKAEYAWSRRALWKVNDVFLTARIMELEKSGKPLKEAIRIAEEDIPNYRLPTSNLFIRKAIQSPFIAFGRYDYGRARAMAKTVENMIGPGKTGEERIRAIGQALIMIGVGYYGYRAGNTALQYGQDKLRTALGPTWGPRIAGSKPMVIGGIGGFGPARATAEYVARKFGLDADEKNWATMLGSWMTLAPAGELMVGVPSNRDTFTGQPIINEYGTPAGQIGEGLGFVAGQINPLQLAIESMRKGVLPGIGPQFGVQQEYKGPPGKVKRMLRGEARAQERRDPTAQLMKHILPRNFLQ